MSLEKTARVPVPPKWVTDLNSGLPPKSKNATSIPDPPGYTSAKSLSAKNVRVCDTSALMGLKQYRNRKRMLASNLPQSR
jgi:hypothetical protein